jgi:hypothetical protein
MSEKEKPQATIEISGHTQDHHPIQGAWRVTVSGAAESITEIKALAAKAIEAEETIRKIR